MKSPNANVDRRTVDSFGHEWASHDQDNIAEDEIARNFQDYFAIFPWDSLEQNSEGFDMGCGSGRWANLVAPRVGTLHCIDPAEAALEVARRKLRRHDNVFFHNTTTGTAPLEHESQDFGYSLGVLHHIPDTEAALADCTRLLKPGAPFLLYLYYRFDNRPWWFRGVWKTSELLRGGISRLPAGTKNVATDIAAAAIYWPVARSAAVAEKLGAKVAGFPLSHYRHQSFATMRTDSRDRFGTPLEQRFTKEEITAMMETCGLENIKFSENMPYWVAVGIKA